MLCIGMGFSNIELIIYNYNLINDAMYMDAVSVVHKILYGPAMHACFDDIAFYQRFYIL